MEDYLKYDGRLPEPPYETECDSCESLRAELETAKARAEFLETSVPSHIYDELMDLRDSVDTLRGKLRELDVWLDVWLAKQVDVYHNFRSQYAEGVFNAYDNTKKRLRELGLITEARDAGKG